MDIFLIGLKGQNKIENRKNGWVYFVIWPFLYYSEGMTGINLRC